MAEMIILDAVSVAMVARAARDAAAGLVSKSGPASSVVSMLPDRVSAILRRITPSRSITSDLPDALIRYAVKLDEIAEAAVSLDQREHELVHQLSWWADRVIELESQVAGHTSAAVETRRELALFRGRISGAQAMQRHYLQDRAALADRHDSADADCASELAGS